MNWYKMKSRALILVILLFGLSIGYAYVYGDLKINGIAGVTKQGWDVYWDNAQVVQGSVSQVAPTIIAGTNNTANTKVSFQVDFTDPGQYYEFTVDAVNNGSIDAMITDIEKTVNNIDVNSEQSPLPAYVSYTVTYANGIEIAENHLLAKKTNNTPTRQKYKVKVEFLEDVDSTSLGNETLTLNFKFGITYGQATSSAVPAVPPANFATGSWASIINAYNADDPENALHTAMLAGTTREIQLDLNHDDTPKTTVHLRIANLSNDGNCGTQGFSESACGFVLEIVEVYDTHRMNPYTDASTNGNGNKGGWEHSDIRSYLNGTKFYENGSVSVDYTDIGIIDALPSDLKNKIIDTVVVSGHGPGDNSNFTTTDKLYLLSTHEIWEDDDNNENDGIDYYDTGYSSTRQLDYYASQHITTGSYSSAIKRNLNGVASDCRLRSVRNDYGDSFIFIGNNGYWYASISSNTNGYTTAFRIAE